MEKTLPQLADELAAEQATLDRELAEIELLLRQATSEAERHEARRVLAEERVRALERDDPSAELPEARTALIAQTRRASLMQTQLDVLGGKQRALQRFRDRLSEILPVIRRGSTTDAAGGGDAVASRADNHASDDLAAQEQLRREIARQMHDGPAQSIANIALQAQVVQRLFERQPKQAQAELVELVRMVEHALAATKDFIFDVRPMVLDDLGLVPTLRRSSLERGRRAGIPVRFESVGADRRLASELESALFRVIDDAMVAYLSASPAELTVSRSATTRCAPPACPRRLGPRSSRVLRQRSSRCSYRATARRSRSSLRRASAECGQDSWRGGTNSLPISSRLGCGLRCPCPFLVDSSNRRVSRKCSSTCSA